MMLVSMFRPTGLSSPLSAPGAVVLTPRSPAAPAKGQEQHGHVMAQLPWPAQSQQTLRKNPPGRPGLWHRTLWEAPANTPAALGHLQGAQGWNLV